MSLFDNNTEFVFKFDEIKEPKYVLPQEFYVNVFENDYQTNIMSYKADQDDNMSCKNGMNQESTCEVKCSASEGNSGHSTDDSQIQPIMLNFINGEPQLIELENIISQKVAKGGYNDLVLDCLDLDDEDDLDIGGCAFIRKKQNKSKKQIRALKSELKKCPDWTKKSMRKLAKSIGLTANQVYKWHWDQTNKSKSA